MYACGWIQHPNENNNVIGLPSRDLHGDGIDGSPADSAVFPRYWGFDYNKYRGSDGVNIDDSIAGRDLSPR